MDLETELKFDISTRHTLKVLGVSKEQTDEIEKVLPFCRGILTKPASLSDVRNEIQALHDAAVELEKKFFLLATCPQDNKPRWEARQRLRRAGLSKYMDQLTAADKINRSEFRLIQILAKCALDDAGTDQRRHYAAHPLPVELIDQALRTGFHKKYKTRPFPPYKFDPSRNPNTNFFRVVQICYAVITGDPTVNPARPVRAFIDEKKAEQETIKKCEALEESYLAFEKDYLEKEIARLEKILHRLGHQP